MHLHSGSKWADGTIWTSNYSNILVPINKKDRIYFYLKRKLQDRQDGQDGQDRQDGQDGQDRQDSKEASRPIGLSVFGKEERSIENRASS